MFCVGRKEEKGWREKLEVTCLLGSVRHEAPRRHCRPASAGSRWSHHKLMLVGSSMWQIAAGFGAAVDAKRLDNQGWFR